MIANTWASAKLMQWDDACSDWDAPWSV